MSERAVAETQEANAPQVMTRRTDALQRRATNQVEPTALPERLFDAVSSDFMEPRLGYNFSRVKLRANGTLPSLRVRPMIQRLPRNGATALAPDVASPEAETAPMPAPAKPTKEPASPETETTPAPAEPTTEAAAPGETPAPGLLVEDSAAELTHGQMRKSEFLAQLRTAVCAATEPVLARTGRTTEGCPYLDYWFDYYSRRDAQHGERALRRYAPEASRATTAREYIPIVAERVRQGVERWVRTGEIIGVPEGIPITLPGMSLLGGVGSLLSGIGSIFFKAREGGARTVNDPQAIQTQLGDGRPLDSGVRSRMETAFGTGFGHVRAHTDSNAATLAHNLNARAFTVGEHMAFGADEYRPGTLLGDALIAHELAHVVQQGGASDSVASLEVGDTGHNALEADADKAAIGVVAFLWHSTSSMLKNITQNTMPHSRSGLRLQRCSTTRTATRTPVTTSQTQSPAPAQAEQAQAPTPPPAPVTCVPNRPLTWADFQGTPTGNHSAWTKFHPEIVTEQGQQIIRAVFESANSWVRPQFANPTNRAITNCGPNISNCEQFFDAEAAAGRTGGTFRLATLTGCAAAITPDPSIEATSRAECTSVLGPECDRVARLESERLLRHEQLHFDIGCVLAEKGTVAIVQNPNVNSQTILNAVISKSNQLSIGTPNEYDTDTNHGCDAGAQANWETRVQNNLPTVNIP